MQKKFITAILSVLLLMSACGTADGRQTQPAADDKQTQPTADDKQAQPAADDRQAQPAADDKEQDYKEIYTQAVTENTDSYTSFSLIYLNDDNIPELVVYNNYYLSYSVYTVKDDALFCMADSLNTVELTYFARTGILCEFARWNGGGDEGGYGIYYYQASNDRTLTDDDTPLLHSVYNAVYDEENVYTGEGIVEYYYMGQETDEAAYDTMADSLGITESGEKLCLENAMEKEEMLDFLTPSRSRSPVPPQKISDRK